MPLPTLRHVLASLLLATLAGTGCAAHPARGPGSLSAPVAVDASPSSTRDLAVVSLSAPPADWHPLDGRTVHITAPLTVSGNHALHDKGEVIAAFGPRLQSPTEVARPGPAANALARDNARRTVVVVAPPLAAGATTRWLAPAGQLLRAGSQLDDVHARVRMRGDTAYLQLLQAPAVRAAPRPAAPVVAGDVRISSFNLENFFNGDGHGGGFPTPRGAATPVQFERQRDKLVQTILAMDPDVAALMEVENDGYGPDSAIAQLVDALNAGSGPGPAATGGSGSGARPGTSWRFIDAGSGPGDDQIRVGILYRADRVTPVGQPATLTGGPYDNSSRVPLAQAFRAGRGPVFVVVANHLKSKGCGKSAGQDADQRDGQACWNALRIESARRLQTWLSTDPTRSGSQLIALLGDFNAYAMEDPIRLFTGSGWLDAGSRAEQPAYSFVYDGQAGRLDHALLSPQLAARLVDARHWHTNADEAEPVGDGDGGTDAPASGAPATTSATPRRADAGPWRSSDHDPLLVGLRLRAP